MKILTKDGPLWTTTHLYVKRPECMTTTLEELLSEYDFEITYIKGIVNRVADALSQRPCIFLVLTLQTNLCEKILTLQCDDDWYKVFEGFIGQNTMMVP